MLNNGERRRHIAPQENSLHTSTFCSTPGGLRAKNKDRVSLPDGEHLPSTLFIQDSFLLLLPNIQEKSKRLNISFKHHVGAHTDPQTNAHFRERRLPNSYTVYLAGLRMDKNILEQ